MLLLNAEMHITTVSRLLQTISSTASGLVQAISWSLLSFEANSTESIQSALDQTLTQGTWES